MPFKTSEELNEMTKRDPKMAMMLVNKAKSSGKPVVDEGNPGYGPSKKQGPSENARMGALKRRMNKMTPSNPNDESEDVTNRRKSMGY
jgi:hypothetical protein